MDFKCANCKHRTTWDCEDYHWGYWDTKKCNDGFELDIDTLTDKEKSFFINIASALKECMWERIMN